MPDVASKHDTLPPSARPSRGCLNGIEGLFPLPKVGQVLLVVVARSELVLLKVQFFDSYESLPQLDQPAVVNGLREKLLIGQ